MKRLSCVLAFLLLTSCDLNGEKRLTENYDLMVQDIIDADKSGDKYITLNNRYAGVMGQVINYVALKDGWEPAGGQTANTPCEGCMTRYMQSIRKVDADLYLTREPDGKLKLHRHSKDVK